MKNTALALFLMIATGLAHGQANIAGLLYASNFANWSVPQGNRGPSGWSDPAACRVTSGGVNFNAFTVGVPVQIFDTGNPANSEVVTPYAVTINAAGCSLGISPTRFHQSFVYRTATAGFGEAIGFAGNHPYQIIVTPDWQTLGGQTSYITSSIGNANVTILDQRSAVIIPYLWSGSAYVADPFGGGGGAVASVFARTGAIIAQNGDYTFSQVTGAAPLASPAFTGNPTAPTQSTSPCDNSTKIATDQFVVTCAGSAQIPATSVLLKGSGTAGSSVAATAGDITSLLGYTPVNPSSLPTTPNVIKGNNAGGLVAASPGNDFVSPNIANGMNPIGTASAGNNQSSNQFQLQGNYWNGSVGTGDFFTQQDVPASSATNPTMLNIFGHSGSSGGAEGIFTYPTSFPGFKGPVADAQWFGAYGDAYAPQDGCATTASSTTVTCGDGPFVAGDVGKIIWVRGAGASGVAFHATINAVPTNSTVTVSAAATGSVSAAPGNAVYGHDDVTAIQACFQYSATSATQCILHPKDSAPGPGNVGFLVGSGGLQLVGNNTSLENSASTVIGSSAVKGMNLFCEYNGDCLSLAAGPIQGSTVTGISFQEDPSQPASRAIHLNATAGTYGNGGLFVSSFNNVEVDNPALECLWIDGGGGMGYGYNLPNQVLTFNTFQCNGPNQSHTANLIKMTGQVAQILFLNGQTNGLGYSGGSSSIYPNPLVAIEEKTSGLSDSPEDVKFFGYTIEVGTQGLYIGEGTSNIHFDNGYIENVSSPLIAGGTSGVKGLTFNGNHIANSGNTTAVAQFTGGVTGGMRDNYEYGSAVTVANLAVCTGTGNAVTDLAKNSGNTVASVNCPTSIVNSSINNVYYVDGFTSSAYPGIGVAQTAWSSGTYPLCTAVSYSSNNYLAVGVTTGVTPGTNKDVWWPAPSNATPTQSDCAFYYTAGQADQAGSTLTIKFGDSTFSGPYITNLGFVEPANGAQVNVRGVGRGVNGGPTLLKAGGDIGWFVSSPDKSGSLPYNLIIDDIAFNGNGQALGCLQIYGQLAFRIEHIYCSNWNPTSAFSIPIQIGDGTSPYHNGGYQAILNDIFVQGNGGNLANAAVVTAVVSGGSPVFTVSNGGSFVNAPAHVYLWGYGTGLNQTSPCTTTGTLTPTYTGSGPYVLTGVTVSGFSGCTGTLYAYVPDISARYGMIISLITDSTFNDLVVANAGWQYGIFYNGSASDVMNHEHVYGESQTFIHDTGSNVHVGAEPDTPINVSIDSTSAQTTFMGTNIVSASAAAQNPGVVGFYLPNGGNVLNSSCGNATTSANVFNLVVNGSGPVPHGGSFGNVNVVNGLECDTLTRENSYANQLTVPGLVNYIGTSGGSVNAMTGAASISNYEPGLQVRITPNLANTSTTPTLNVNSLGAVTITKFGASALAVGDLSTTAIADLTYDGTNFELLNPQSSTTYTGANNVSISGTTISGIPYAVDTGSANAYAVALPNTSYTGAVAGTVFYVKFTNASTGASTIAINGGSTRTLHGLAASAITSGSISVNTNYLCFDDGTNINITPVGGSTQILFTPDSVFQLFNSTTPTKKGVFSLANNTASTNRTWNMPDFSGTLQSNPTATFSVSGCGTATSLTGGGLAGKFTGASSTCTPVVTTGITASHGYSCWINDETTSTAAFRETGSNATTATFTAGGTVGSTDVIDWGCEPY